MNRGEYQRDWRERNLDKVKQYQIDKNIKRRKQRKELREYIFNFFGNICNQCGFTNSKALCIDHVNGGGTKERKSTKNTKGLDIGYYIKIKEGLDTGKYQCLCANCNMIKKLERNEK